MWNDITQSVAIHRIVSECHATFSKNKQMDYFVDITHDLWTVKIEVQRWKISNLDDVKLNVEGTVDYHHRAD